MKKKTLIIIVSSLVSVTVLLFGGIFIYSKLLDTNVKVDPSITTTSTEESIETIPLTETSIIETPSTTTDSTLSAEELQSQIDENNRLLESQRLESESIAAEESILESKRIEESIQASISESIKESEEESRRATTTTREPSETKAPTESEKPKPTEAPKPKGDPKLSKSSITIAVGDTDSFISQAQNIEVLNSNVGAMLDYSGVSFYTPGTYTCYFNAMDGSYSLALTVIVE